MEPSVLQRTRTGEERLCSIAQRFQLHREVSTRAIRRDDGTEAVSRSHTNCGGSRRPQVCDDPRGITTDAADQRRTQAVLVSKSQEGETGSAIDKSAVMARITIAVEHRQANPVEVRTKPRAPDDRGHVQRTAILDERPATNRINRPSGPRDARPRDVRRRDTDEGIAGKHATGGEAAAKPGRHASAQQRRPQPAVDVPSEQAPGNRARVAAR